MKDAIMRKMMLGPDARSTMGIFSRGKPIYNGTSAAPRRGKQTAAMNQKQAIERRLRSGR